MTTIAYTVKDAYSLDDLPKDGETVFFVKFSVNAGHWQVVAFTWGKEFYIGYASELTLGLVHRNHESAQACCDMLNGNVGEKLVELIAETAKEKPSDDLDSWEAGLYFGESEFAIELRTLLQLDD